MLTLRVQVGQVVKEFGELLGWFTKMRSPTYTTPTMMNLIRWGRWGVCLLTLQIICKQVCFISVSPLLSNAGIQQSGGFCLCFFFLPAVSALDGTLYLFMSTFWFWTADEMHCNPSPMLRRNTGNVDSRISWEIQDCFHIKNRNKLCLKPVKKIGLLACFLNPDGSVPLQSTLFAIFNPVIIHVTPKAEFVCLLLHLRLNAGWERRSCL